MDLADDALPNETTILKFRPLLEKHGLTCELFDAVNAYLDDKGQLFRQSTIVNTTIITAEVTQTEHLLHGEEKIMWFALSNLWIACRRVRETA